MVAFVPFTAAPAFKDAFVTAAKSLMVSTGNTGVLVVPGHPGQAQDDDIIAFTAVNSEQEPATFGSRRQREEALVLDVVISCFRGGGLEQEQVCSARAYALLAILEQHVRVTDTELGGVVRECFMIGHTSDGSTDPAVLAAGRLIEIKAQFAAKARISS